MKHFRVFIGMETSGALRRAFQGAGWWALSVDRLAAEDIGVGVSRHNGGHHVGDVFDMWTMYTQDHGFTFDLAVLHPDCTYLTGSAEWTYKDGPYRQKVKPGTVVGAPRRAMRRKALRDFRRCLSLDCSRIVVENPVGAANTRIRKPDQIVQPHWFGDDASKKTCLWRVGDLPDLVPVQHVPPRYVNGLPRWANQTDSGQNRLSPGAARWKDRSRTWPGLAQALTDQYTAHIERKCTHER